MQDLVLLGRQLDLLLADADFAAAEVDAQVADLDAALIGCLRRGGAARDGANARQQLAMAERLGHVVVGAEVEAPDAVGLFAARGQQDDRHGSALAQLAADVEAAQTGQHHVEHHQVGHRALGERQRLLAAVRQGGSVALLAQRVADDVGDVAVVVDDEDVHAFLVSRSRAAIRPRTARRAARCPRRAPLPPCRSTSDLTMARPRPLPASPRCCASRPR